VAIGEMLAASLQETGRLDAAERVLRRAVADTAKPDPAACCRLSCRLASLLAAQKHDAEAAAARGACACPP
jgi:predicted negative regulator of RcsB-dependent stress response